MCNTTSIYVTAIAKKTSGKIVQHSTPTSSLSRKGSNTSAGESPLLKKLDGSKGK